MLKVAFWVFGLLKSTKHELVLVCFNTPIDTMKLLSTVISIAIALAPVSAFAVSVQPLHFPANSYCGNAASANTWYTIKANKGQQVTIGVPLDYSESVLLKVVNINTGKVVTLKQIFGVSNDLLVFRFITGGNYTYRVEFRDMDTNRKIGGSFSTCIE